MIKPTGYLLAVMDFLLAALNAWLGYSTPAGHPIMATISWVACIGCAAFGIAQLYMVRNS